MNTSPVHIFWFRRDLRLHDNAGLYHALTSGIPVLPVFIFDKEILGKLDDRDDKRVLFIYRQIEKLKKELAKLGSDLLVLHDTPAGAWRTICSEYQVRHVFANHDYEPAAINRDLRVREFLSSQGIAFSTYKDQCIFERSEIVKDDGSPYTVFTPYSKKWKAALHASHLREYPSQQQFGNFLKIQVSLLMPIEALGFMDSDFRFPPLQIDHDLVSAYTTQRNYPAVAGTSRVGIHLRFGTVSVRSLVKLAKELNETWLNELIWRDFYMMILSHFPHVAHSAFKKEYEQIRWMNRETDFNAWCSGITGYPLVDAGMRELNETGFMHNRVRMVTASFLTRHLLIDWRWGEAYFAGKLLDFDLSANNGGWQWAAGCGTDAAPYFRIFNPAPQAQKFDPQGAYIRKWVPEAGSIAYPKPVIEHEVARRRALEVYKKGLAER